MMWKFAALMFVVAIVLNFKLGLTRQSVLINERSLQDNWSKNCTYYTPFAITTQSMRVDRPCDLVVSND